MPSFFFNSVLVRVVSLQPNPDKPDKNPALQDYSLHEIIFCLKMSENYF